MLLAPPLEPADCSSPGSTLLLVSQKLRKAACIQRTSGAHRMKAHRNLLRLPNIGIMRRILSFSVLPDRLRSSPGIRSPGRGFRTGFRARSLWIQDPGDEQCTNRPASATTPRLSWRTNRPFEHDTAKDRTPVLLAVSHLQPESREEKVSSRRGTHDVPTDANSVAHPDGKSARPCWGLFRFTCHHHRRPGPAA